MRAILRYEDNIAGGVLESEYSSFPVAVAIGRALADSGACKDGKFEVVREGAETSPGFIKFTQLQTLTQV